MSTDLSSGEPNVPAPMRMRGASAFVILAGVVLPCAAIVFELTTRICAAFLDPVPTVWHAALLFIVPISNALGVWAWYRPSSKPLAPLTFLIGLSIGTCAVYSLQLLPIAPFSVVGILVFGIGLLGLSPYFALASSIKSYSRLMVTRPSDTAKPGRALWGGIIASVALLGLFLGSNYVTVAGLRMASSSDQDTSSRGIRMIRTFGSKSALLRACYDLPAGIWADSAFPSSDELTTNREQARAAYYRVTGNAFNSTPPPRLLAFRSQLTSDYDFDSDVGGEAVKGIARDLSLSSSRVDTVVEPDGLLAYTEWTLIFKNSSNDEREARAELALPPGGVVSRLTLWVHGEEREAAFSSRGAVREAYQQVAVVQRKDPVLVTTCGPDRVLMQCFPVPANGGTMKVRVGITAPLIPQSYDKALLVLPHFAERNFSVQDSPVHSVLVESPSQMADIKGLTDKTEVSFRPPSTDVTSEQHTGTTIKTVITDQALSGGRTIICTRNPEANTTWSPDSLDPQRYQIVQTLRKSPQTAPSKIILVVDGSKRMGSALPDIAKALSSLPADTSFSVILAGDRVEAPVSGAQINQASLAKASDAVLALDCAGGVDNRPALLAACDESARTSGSVIVWVHGPQPLTSDALAEQLLQVIERHPGRTKIISVSAADGRNTILAELEKSGAVEVTPRIGILVQDLVRLFSEWRPGSEGSFVVQRDRVPVQYLAFRRVSSHAARLWARDEVLRNCRAGDYRKLLDTMSLAANYQIVTPVSGAVVLENAEQYKEAGLNPVDPTKTPSVVPEPGSLIALAGGVGAVAAMIRRRRRS